VCAWFYGNQKKPQEEGGGTPTPPRPQKKWRGEGGGLRPSCLPCSQILGMANFRPQKFSSAFRADSEKKYLVWFTLAQKRLDGNPKRGFQKKFRFHLFVVDFHKISSFFNDDKSSPCFLSCPHEENSHMSSAVSHLVKT